MHSPCGDAGRRGVLSIVQWEETAEYFSVVGSTYEAGSIGS